MMTLFQAVLYILFLAVIASIGFWVYGHIY